MMKIIRGDLAIGLLLLAIVLCLPARQSLGGKPTAPPPPTHYKIQFFTIRGAPALAQQDFNNQSQAVGGYYSPTAMRDHAWFYDPDVDPTTAINLNDPALGVVGVPPGWFMASARGLNERGAIVGWLERYDDPDGTLRRGFVLNLLPHLLNPARNH